MTENNAAQPGLTDDNVKLDINGATWLGMRVAGWTWEEDAFSPDQHPSENTVRLYASHWSTGPHNAERLYRESDIAALLSKLRAEGVQAGDERASFLLEEALGYIRMFSNPGATAEEMTAIAQAGLRRFTAALASAPVADKGCPHIDEPRSCWRVRCQLGKKCVEPVTDTSAARAPVAGEAVTDDMILHCWNAHVESPDDAWMTDDDKISFGRALLAQYVAPQASEAVRNAAVYISTEHLHMLQFGELGQLCALHGSGVLRSVPGPGLTPLFALPPTSEDVDAVIGSLMCRANSAERMWHKYRDKCAQLEANSDRYLFLRDHASHSWAGWIDTNYPGPKERPEAEIDEWIAQIKQEGEWNYQTDKDGGDCAKGAGDE